MGDSLGKFYTFLPFLFLVKLLVFIEWFVLHYALLSDSAANDCNAYADRHPHEGRHADSSCASVRFLEYTWSSITLL